MAGATVLEWATLDSEIKTAGLKDVGGCSSSTRPTGLCSRIGSSCSSGFVWLAPVVEETRLTLVYRLVNANMRHNWRSGKSIRKVVTLGHSKPTALQLIASSMKIRRSHMSPNRPSVRPILGS